MELKEFVTQVLVDLVGAVEDAKNQSQHDMHLTSHKESNQTVEFDIAVTAEDGIRGEGKAGIKVFSVIEGGTSVEKEVKNSTVTRIKFGMYVDSESIQEGRNVSEKSSSRMDLDPYRHL